MLNQENFIIWKDVSSACLIFRLLFYLSDGGPRRLAEVLWCEIRKENRKIEKRIFNESPEKYV